MICIYCRISTEMEKITLSVEMNEFVIAGGLAMVLLVVWCFDFSSKVGKVLEFFGEYFWGLSSLFITFLIVTLLFSNFPIFNLLIRKNKDEKKKLGPVGTDVKEPQ